MNDLLKGVASSHHFLTLPTGIAKDAGIAKVDAPSTPIDLSTVAADKKPGFFGGDAAPAVLPSNRGVHQLKGNRVVGVQIKIPDGHPLKQAIDNAFHTDTQLKNPASAIKQYDRALKQNRTKDGAIRDTMVEMIGRARKGLALNHLVAAAIKDGELHAKLAAQAKEELQTAIDLGHGQGRTYGAPYYNLATLHAHLGQVDEGLAALSQAIESDPDFFQKLSQKDGDLKPLAGPEFTGLMQMKLTEERANAVFEIFGVEGVDGLLSKLIEAEEERLQLGSTRGMLVGHQASPLQGPHYGIPLSMEVFLTMQGPMKVDQYRSETTHGTAFIPLSHSQLSADAVQEMKDDLQSLIASIKSGETQLSMEGAYHEIL